MSKPDPSQENAHEPGDAAPGPLARRDGDPAFDEPWQAQVLALAAKLIEGGTFTNAQWSSALGAELRRAGSHAAPDDAATYYLSALAALEALLDNGRKLSTDEVDARTEAWRAAYLRTPHGRPVEL